LVVVAVVVVDYGGLWRGLPFISAIGCRPILLDWL
jgi:hypothetical protein